MYFHLEHGLEDGSSFNIGTDLNVGQISSFLRSSNVASLSQSRIPVGKAIEALEHSLVALKVAHVDATVKSCTLITITLSCCGLKQVKFVKGTFILTL